MDSCIQNRKLRGCQGVFTLDWDELRRVRICNFAAVYMRPGRKAWSITCGEERCVTTLKTAV